MNGMQHVETLHIQRNAVTPFFDAAADAGVPVRAEVIRTKAGVAA